MDTTRCIVVLGLAAMTTLTSPATAQQAGRRAGFAPNAPQHPAETTEAFGPGNQWAVVPPSRFTPLNGSTAPNWADGGYVTPVNGGVYWAHVDLPLGAHIIELLWLIHDSSDTCGWILSLEEYETTYSIGSGGTQVHSLLSLSPEEQPGFTILGEPVDLTLRLRADVNGDGWSHYSHCVLVATAPSCYTGDELRYAGAVLKWSRTVSPAPATATFADVPAGHWAFQFVEALASAGITAGCGGDNYCPGSPITRAEMAVYLAVALGLHWPS